MYDRATTAAAIDAESQRLGWQLRYSSQSAVDDAIGHFQDLWDADRGRLTRPLVAWEQQFITNERQRDRKSVV